MNTKQFLEEALNYSNCPADFSSVYQEFQVYQAATWKTLQEFHRVCEKYQINYQLAYGSLLGIIRDGGQIPWDYDVDVLVPFNEKDKLVNALSQELSPKYYFYSPEKSKKCRHVIMRLAPVEYRSEVLHVDVFYYIGSPNKEKDRVDFSKKVRDISLARYYKLVNPIEEAAGNKKRLAKLYLNKVLYKCRKLSTIEAIYNQLCNEYAIKESDYLITADTFADWYQIPKDYILETVLTNTENGTFRIPKRTEELLSLIYGDYRKIPDIKDRISEVVKHHSRLKYFERIKG